MLFISSVSEGRVSQFHQGAAAAEWRRVVCLWNQRFQPLLSHVQGKHAKHYDRGGDWCRKIQPGHITTVHTHFFYEVQNFMVLGVVKRSDGRGWMMLMSRQAFLPISTCTLTFSHTKTSNDWCIRSASDARVLKWILSRCVGTSLSETGSKIPSREAARRPCKDAF